MLGFVRRVFGLPLRSVVFDAVTAGVVAIWPVTSVVSGLSAREWLIGAWMAIALLMRRRWPVHVFVVVGLAGVVQLLLNTGIKPYDVAVLMALYAVVKYADRMAWAWAAAGAIVVGAVWFGMVGSREPGLVGVGALPWYQRTGSLIIYATPVWLIGLTMRTRRLYVRSLEERAATAERERDQRARLAVVNERGRIARELHDVVAHSLAVMIVQADGATYAIDGDPGTAKRAVRTVADTGREALADMRRLVAVLRDGGGADDEAMGDDPGATPADVGADERRSVGLGRLDPLLDRFRRAGLRVGLVRDGAVRALPTGVELAGYRIVQESLTNTLKHAGTGTTATVRVAYREASVRVEICDDGAGRAGAGAPAGDDRFASPALPGGHGLLGMRERVAVYGGEFGAGPRVGPGWRVTADIPVSAGAAEAGATGTVGAAPGGSDAEVDVVGGGRPEPR